MCNICSTHLAFLHQDDDALRITGWHGATWESSTLLRFFVRAPQASPPLAPDVSMDTTGGGGYYPSPVVFASGVAVEQERVLAPTESISQATETLLQITEPDPHATDPTPETGTTAQTLAFIGDRLANTLRTFSSGTTTAIFDGGRAPDKIYLRDDAVDRVIYRIDVRDTWRAFDGADTIYNFKRGEDVLVLTGIINEEEQFNRYDFYHNNDVKLSLLRAPGEMNGPFDDIAGVRLFFPASGTTLGGIATGNSLTIYFADSSESSINVLRRFYDYTADTIYRGGLSSLLGGNNHFVTESETISEAEPVSLTGDLLIVAHDDRRSFGFTSNDTLTVHGIDTIAASDGTNLMGTQNLKFTWIWLDVRGEVRTFTASSGAGENYYLTDDDIGALFWVAVSYIDPMAPTTRVPTLLSHPSTNRIISADMPTDSRTVTLLQQFAGGFSVNLREINDVPTATYRLADGGLDNDNVQITGNHLSFKLVPSVVQPTDENLDNTYQIRYIYDNGAALSTRTLRINVLVGIFENNDVTTVVYHDAENGTFELMPTTPDNDNGFFTINEQGQVFFRESPDFEQPQDSDANNIYKVAYTRTQDDTITTIRISVGVVDVEEISTPPIPDNHQVGGVISGILLDGGSTLVFDEGTGDNSLFSLRAPNAGSLSWDILLKIPFMYDDGGDNDYEIFLTETDADGQSFKYVLKVSVFDSSIPVFYAYEHNPLAKPAFTIEGSGFSFSEGFGDNEHFRIDAEGRVFFRASPDYEAPVDQGGNNVYDLRIRYTDTENVVQDSKYTLHVVNLEAEKSFAEAERGGSVYAESYTANDPIVSAALAARGDTPAGTNALVSNILWGHYINIRNFEQDFAIHEVQPLLITWSFLTPDSPGYNMRALVGFDRESGNFPSALVDQEAITKYRVNLQAAFDYISRFIPVQFVEISDSVDLVGDIRVDIYDTSTRPSYAVTGLATFRDGALTLSLDYHASFSTHLHEIAHVLGLKHPFEQALRAGFPGDESLRSSPSTVLSYYGSRASRDQNTEFRRLTHYDLRALQFLYGQKDDLAGGLSFRLLHGDANDPPTRVEIVNGDGNGTVELPVTEIPENTDITARTLLAKIRFYDSDGGTIALFPFGQSSTHRYPHLFVISNRVEVTVDDGGSYLEYDLSLRAGVVLDYEATPELSVQFVVRGALDLTFDYTVRVTDVVNEPTSSDRKPIAITISPVQNYAPSRATPTFWYAEGAIENIKIANITLTDDNLGTNQLAITRIVSYVNARDLSEFKDYFEFKKIDETHFQLWLRSPDETVPTSFTSNLLTNILTIEIGIADATTGTGLGPRHVPIVFAVEEINPDLAPLTISNAITQYAIGTRLVDDGRLADIDNVPLSGGGGRSLAVSNTDDFEIRNHSLYLRDTATLSAGTHNVQISFQNVLWYQRPPPVIYTFEVVPAMTDARPTEIEFSVDNVTLIAGATTQRTKLADIRITDDGLGSNGPRFAVTPELAMAVEFLENSDGGFALWLVKSFSVPTTPVVGNDLSHPHRISFELDPNTTTGLGDFPDSINFFVNIIDGATAGYTMESIVLNENVPTNKIIFQSVAGAHLTTDYGDNDLFRIDVQGGVHFKDTPDFENPGDDATDNIYQFEVESSTKDKVRGTVSIEDIFNEQNFSERITSFDPTVFYNEGDIPEEFSGDARSIFSGRAYELSNQGASTLTWSMVISGTPAATSNNAISVEMLMLLRPKLEAAFDEITEILPHLKFIEVVHSVDRVGDIAIYAHPTATGVVAYPFTIDTRLEIGMDASDAALLRGIGKLLGLKNPHEELYGFPVATTNLTELTIMAPENNVAKLTQLDMAALNAIYAKIPTITPQNNVTRTIASDGVTTRESFIGFITNDFTNGSDNLTISNGLVTSDFAIRNLTELWIRGGTDIREIVSSSDSPSFTVTANNTAGGAQIFEVIVTAPELALAGTPTLTLTETHTRYEETILGVPGLPAQKLATIMVTETTNAPILLEGNDVFEILPGSSAMRYDLYSKEIGFDYETQRYHTAVISFEGENQPLRYFSLRVNNVDDPPRYLALVETVSELAVNTVISDDFTLAKIVLIDDDGNTPTLRLIKPDNSPIKLIGDELRLTAGDYDTIGHFGVTLVSVEAGAILEEIDFTLNIIDNAVMGSANNYDIL